MGRLFPAVMRRLILNYHAVAAAGASRTGMDPIYALDADVLRAQLGLIQSMGLPVLPLSGPSPPELEGGPLGISLTFDDGHPSDRDVVLPLLDEMGMVATFCLPTHLLDDDPGCAARVRALAAAGHAIAAHGHHHRYLDALPAGEQADELCVSKARLQALLGTSVPCFALPGGKYRRQTLQLARDAGYAHVLSTQFGCFEAGEPPFLLPRWTIKRSTSLPLLARVLAGDPWLLRRQAGYARVKRGVNRLLGNTLTDRLNYLLRG